MAREKTPADVLYALEHFGIPTRDSAVEAAKKMVASGHLAQDDVDGACQKYQVMMDAGNIAKYGTATPTAEQETKYSLDLINRGKTTIHSDASEDSVRTSMGKYTDGDKLQIPAIAGCLATILYFEGEQGQEGILTHFPPIEIGENIAKIVELRDQNMQGNYRVEKGIILTEREGKASKHLESGVRSLFPSMTLDTLVYDQNKIGAIGLDVSARQWTSGQYGVQSLL